MFRCGSNSSPVVLVCISYKVFNDHSHHLFVQCTDHTEGHWELWERLCDCSSNTDVHISKWHFSSLSLLHFLPNYEGRWRCRDTGCFWVIVSPTENPALLISSKYWVGMDTFKCVACYAPLFLTKDLCYLSWMHLIAALLTILVFARLFKFHILLCSEVWKTFQNCLCDLGDENQQYSATWLARATPVSLHSALAGEVASFHLGTSHLVLGCGNSSLLSHLSTF